MSYTWTLAIRISKRSSRFWWCCYWRYRISWLKIRVISSIPKTATKTIIRFIRRIRRSSPSISKPTWRKVPTLSKRWSTWTYKRTYLFLIRLKETIFAQHLCHLLCISQPLRFFKISHNILKLFHRSISITIAEMILYWSHHICKNIKFTNHNVDFFFKRLCHVFDWSVLLLLILISNRFYLLQDVLLLEHTVSHLHCFWIDL